jgi:membrane associated rhomboid family serine protease
MFPLYDLIPHHRFPWLTLLVILVNVGVMVSQGSEVQIETAYEYGFVPKRASEIGRGQPVRAVVKVPNDHGVPVQVGVAQLSTDAADVYPTFFTTMFLHGNWLHLVMNMWMLWVFGNNVEDRLGHFMYVCFYLLGGLVATLCQWAYQPNDTTPIIGASGAVAAVLGGYALTYPWAKVKTLIFLGIPLIFDLPALVVLGFWFLAQMASGLVVIQGGMQQPVAFWAHIGGFIAGVVLMPFMSIGASPPGTDWRKEAEDMFRFDDPRRE